MLTRLMNKGVKPFQCCSEIRQYRPVTMKVTLMYSKKFLLSVTQLFIPYFGINVKLNYSDDREIVQEPFRWGKKQDTWSENSAVR